MRNLTRVPHDRTLAVISVANFSIVRYIQGVPLCTRIRKNESILRNDRIKCENSPGDYREACISRVSNAAIGNLNQLNNTNRVWNGRISLF